jgi:hypothetical protein
MFASLSFQNITKLSAHAFPDLESTPFFIQFESSENSEDGGQYSRGEICLHLADKVLAESLVKAINRTVAEHSAKSEQPALEEVA